MAHRGIGFGLFVAAAACVACVACDGGGVTNDAGIDSGADVVTDTATDTGTEAATTCSPAGSACQSNGGNGLCNGAQCAPCLDYTDDTKCALAYFGTDGGASPFICAGQRCVPGDCHTSQDCNGAICGVVNANTCGPCTTNAQCQSDYGATATCQAGTCTSKPVIEAISPLMGNNAVALGTPISIFGHNFRNPVKVELVDSTQQVVKTVTSITPLSGTEIDTTLPTTGMNQDAYLVRVTDLDNGDSGTFSAFVVASMGPTAVLQTFAAETSLVTGRRMLAGVSAKDDLGNDFVYGIGGDTGSTTLDDVEVAPVTSFGHLGTWRSIRAPNHLTVARDAPAAVAVPVFDPNGSPYVPAKTYIYVVGGRDGSSTVLGSVERAVVLRHADAPRLTYVAASATTGTLAAGQWYYRVSAMLDPSDADTNGSETLPSDEKSVTLATSGAVNLTWSKVTVNGKDAVGYRVYRTATVNGQSLNELLLASTTATSYTDTGGNAAGDAPLPPGSLGAWKVVTPASAVRWGHGAALVTDSQGNRFLWVLGGKSDSTSGYLDSVQAAPVDPQGQLGAFGSGSGTPTALPAPMAFFELAVETPAVVSSYTGTARFFTLGGVTATGASAEITQSDVGTSGANGSWSAYSGTGSLQARAGAEGTIIGEALFALGGATAATTTTFTNVTSGGRKLPFANGDLQSPVQTSNLSTSTALGATVCSGPFVYFIGGSTDGSNALPTVQMTF